MLEEKIYILNFGVSDQVVKKTDSNNLSVLL